MVSKFQVGDKVRLSGRCPAFTDLPRSRPRTIIQIRYDVVRQCNFYLLGSNGRGATGGDGNPRWGYWRYWFRSYHLEPYEPRRYHFKRPYQKATETPQGQNLAGQGSSGLVSPIKATTKDAGDCK